MVYHDIIDVDATDIKEVVDYAQKLYKWQQETTVGNLYVESKHRIEDYLETNSLMFIMMGVISDIYNLDIGGVNRYDKREWRWKEDNFNIPVKDILRDVRHNDNNKSLFRDIVSMCDVMYTSQHDSDDFNLSNMLVHIIYHNYMQIREQLYEAYREHHISQNDIHTCQYILQSIDRIYSKTYKDISYGHSMGISEMILSMSEMISFNNKEIYQYDNDSISYVIYTHLLPQLCASISGLHGVVWLIYNMWRHNARSKSV